MRLTSLLCRKRCRAPQKEELVPFKEILPLKLNDSVSGKSEKSSETACLQEIALLFACFQKTDFNQSLCLKEIESLQNCHSQARLRVKAHKEMERKGIITAGAKKLNHTQLNRFLQRFPQPK